LPDNNEGLKMADLNETGGWVNGIYQLETTDIVQGGPDGISNQQAKQLAQRTAYLKQKYAITAVVGASHTLVPANAGSVLRFSGAGAKTLIVDTVSSHLPECIYHVSNRAASGDLTLTAAGGMVLNPPKGGTLVLEPGDTVSLHCFSVSVMDVLGSTKAP
jgi:hypothetical protein